MRNIIFDFGNVLVKWEPERVYLPYFDGDEARYWYFWRHVCDAEFRNRIDAGQSQRQCIAEQQAKFPEYRKVIAVYSSHWREMLTGEMPGMRQLLQELKSAPRNHLYGLTNWSMETFPEAREQFGILQMIDDYVVSGDVGLVKPDPRIFRLLLDRFGLRAEECIFVDDNPDNVAAAQALGLKGIPFHGADALRAALIP